MKNTTSYRRGNKYDSTLTKTEKEILRIYDHIKMKGKIPSPGLVNKQIDILKELAPHETDVKYLFSCC